MSAVLPAGLERLLAAILRQGTRLATLLIVIGIAAHRPWPGPSAFLLDAGLASIILLPVARVAVMALAFAKVRDTRFAILAACVLAIIASGALVALR